jgi:uncharacterized membrane protein
MTHPAADPQLGTSSTGLAPNIAAALSYVLGPITGVVFLVMEKENRYVRFHAAQSVAVGILFIALSIALSILSTVLAFIPVLGWALALLLTLGLSVAGFILWLVLMWKAYSGTEWSAPIAGGFARRMVS